MATPQWRQLVDHVMSVQEKVYETWTTSEGWNNDNPYGREFGENRVPWCVIFDYCMYLETGLKSLVPRVDNVVVFSNWAKQHGMWSEYPSIGAWVNFDNGHTELVTGFDQDKVYTKGGNSVQAGASDNGQGNGVWSHWEYRRAARVIGYFAPKFSDGVCPPTADPHDYRGGKAVDSWRWTAPAIPSTPTPPQPRPPVGPVSSPVIKPPSKPKAPAFPAGIAPNKSTPSAKTLQQLLKDTGWLDKSVPLADNYGPKTQAAVAGFNQKHGLNDRGRTYDPAIGPKGWALLCQYVYG